MDCGVITKLYKGDKGLYVQKVFVLILTLRLGNHDLVQSRATQHVQGHPIHETFRRANNTT